LVRYINFYLSRDHRDARGTGCPLAALSADLPRLEPLARARYGQGVAGLTAKLQAHIAMLGRSDAAAVAASVVAELVGALSLARAVGDLNQSDDILETSRRSVKQRLGLEGYSAKGLVQ
jgi:TetR/AcrR family transcriptional repressor of nem operon